MKRPFETDYGTYEDPSKQMKVDYNEVTFSKSNSLMSMDEPTFEQKFESTEMANDVKLERVAGEARDAILLGRKCAKIMGATCESSKLSISYGEEALRFTCRHGHNFFLTVQKLKETYAKLREHTGEMTDDFLDSLTWCKKCANQADKV